MHTRLLVALPLLVVAAGCADVDLAPPTGHDDVVLRIERSAGMGRMESFFVDTPDLVVTGDGTVYRSGEDGLVTYRISADDIGHLLRDAERAGLLDASTSDRSAQGLMDASTTHVLVDAGTVRRTHEVYGLGQRDQYDDMADFVDEALDSADAQPGTPFEPAAYRVLVDDPDGGHCEVAGERPAVGGPVLAVAPLLPGDDCTGS